jgi:hypothetical protein
MGEGGRKKGGVKKAAGSKFYLKSLSVMGRIPNFEQAR